MSAPKLTLKQTQTLALTPQLLQAIELLTLTNLELNALVEAELESNPLLARADEDAVQDAAPESDSVDSDALNAHAQGALDQDMLFDCVESDSATPRQLQDQLKDAFDADVDNVFHSHERHEGADGVLSHAYDGLSQHGVQGLMSAVHESFGTASDDANRFGESAPCLSTHLREQFYLDTSDPTARLVFEALLPHLDERGYFSDPLDAVAAALGVSACEIADVVALIQRLEPAGVGARTWQECFKLQLQAMGLWSEDYAAFLEHFSLYAAYETRAFKTATGLDDAAILACESGLKRCQLNPVAALEREHTEVRVPDVIVLLQRDGGFAVDVNADTLPRVLVDMRYYREVKELAACARPAQQRSSDDASADHWLSDHFSRANWLVKALHQRTETLMRVSAALVARQSAFLRYGPQHLKPLTLSDIAADIDMSESTVSRTCQGKFIDTPQGILAMRDFFSQSLARSDGADAVSATAVRETIKALIKDEGATVLSDQKLADVLTEMGFDVARRTVAKYREGLKIPTSSLRKRQKRA